MNIENSTNDDRDEETESANENAMYNKPSLVGLSPRLLNDSAPYTFNITDYDETTSIVLTERELFYKSYNPKVGLHTAAVLGGLLVFVIMYLFYRTKLKKAVIRFIRKKRKKDKVFTECEVMGQFIPATVEQKCESLEPSVISGMDQKFFGKSFVIDQIQASIECQKLIVNEHNYSPTIDDQHSKWKDAELPSPSPGIPLPHCNISSQSMTTLDPQEVEQHQLIQKLPSVETDIVKATAQWVQDQPLSSQSASFQDISGVILKVQPHMVRNQIPGSCPLETITSRQHLTPVPLPQTWNKSMPILSENLHVSCENLKLEQKTNYKEEKRVKVPPNLTIPIPDLKEFSSSSRLGYSPVPIPVTPTVMIQNFTSKGSTKNSSLQRNNSNDSMTSNSSEDPLLAQPQVQMGWPGKNMVVPSRTKDSEFGPEIQINTSMLHPIIKIDSMETKL